MDKSTLKIVVIIHEITSLHNLFTELLREKNRLQAILESINEGVFTIDPYWRITSFNRAAERITGYQREEILGKKCYEVFNTPLCQTNCPLKRSLSGLFTIEGEEAEITTKNGKKIPISVSTAPLVDEEGEFIGGVEVFRDLSELKKLEEEIRERYSLGSIIGKSPQMQRVYELIHLVSQTDTHVLIEGETGTGKNLVAKTIHFLSPRKNKPFITISCAAIPEQLLESELFGHEKGAFTGATARKLGKFELAEGGTVFLDEVAELSPALQAKVLRVIEDKEFERVGGTETIKVDVRIISATNQNLKELVEKGRFREDLYYRLKVMVIHLPPLRERREDIPLLVNFFIEKFNQKFGKNIKKVSPQVMDLLLDYEWPGNVRELENAIEHAFIHCKGEIIHREHLPEELTRKKPLPIGELRKMEEEIIRKTLAETGGNKSKAAKLLGISRTTLWRKIKKMEGK
ncbi:sigma 54-interacting transcriptional regulator [Candidatus Calescamantes bacterium]|nr:sigma 54-interacting transcriptional regulator [Candidatus Calescamantes bacterium]